MPQPEIEEVVEEENLHKMMAYMKKMMMTKNGL